MSEDTATRVDEQPEAAAPRDAEPEASAEPAETEPAEPDAAPAPEPETPEPAPVAQTAPAPEPAPEPAPCDVPKTAPVAWWPYLVYLTLWAALVATSVYLLAGPDVVLPTLENPAYPALLLATVVLTALGPLLAVVTWAIAWFESSPGCRGGLLTTALVRGASATLFGVLAWWVALVVIDAIRLEML